MSVIAYQYSDWLCRINRMPVLGKTGLFLSASARICSWLFEAMNEDLIVLHQSSYSFTSICHLQIHLRGSQGIPSQHSHSKRHVSAPTQTPFNTENAAQAITFPWPAPFSPSHSLVSEIASWYVSVHSPLSS